MENQLKLTNILFAYKTLKKHRDQMDMLTLGKHLGFIEAGLHSYGFLEFVKTKDGTKEVKREMKPATKWWKKPKLETYEQAIIRQVENMFTKNNIQF